MTDTDVERERRPVRAIDPFIYGRDRLASSLTLSVLSFPLSDARNAAQDLKTMEANE
jgi:hypothetical protein